MILFLKTSKTSKTMIIKMGKVVISSEMGNDWLQKSIKKLFGVDGNVQNISYM